MNTIDEKINFLLQSINYEWEYFNSSENIITDRYFFPSYEIACFRSFGTINAKMHQIIDIIWCTYTTEFDMKIYEKSISCYQVMENIDKDSRICYQVNALPWPFQKRDLFYFQKKVIKDDLSYILMYSINAPPQNDHVRAIVNISGYVVIPSANKCTLYRIAQIDPGGYIPNFIINHFVGKNANMIKTLQEKFGF